MAVIETCASRDDDTACLAASIARYRSAAGGSSRQYLRHASQSGILRRVPWPGDQMLFHRWKRRVVVTRIGAAAPGAALQ